MVSSTQHVPTVLVLELDLRHRRHRVELVRDAPQKFTMRQRRIQGHPTHVIIVADLQRMRVSSGQCQRKGTRHRAHLHSDLGHLVCLVPIRTAIPLFLIFVHARGNRPTRITASDRP